jgi:hypothetical protein
MFEFIFSFFVGDGFKPFGFARVYGTSVARKWYRVRYGYTDTISLKISLVRFVGDMIIN